MESSKIFIFCISLFSLAPLFLVMVNLKFSMTNSIILAKHQLLKLTFILFLKHVSKTFVTNTLFIKWIYYLIKIICKYSTFKFEYM